MLSLIVSVYNFNVALKVCVQFQQLYILLQGKSRVPVTTQFSNFAQDCLFPSSPLSVLLTQCLPSKDRLTKFPEQKTKTKVKKQKLL